MLLLTRVIARPCVRIVPPHINRSTNNRQIAVRGRRAMTKRARDHHHPVREDDVASRVNNDHVDGAGTHPVQQADYGGIRDIGLEYAMR